VTVAAIDGRTATADILIGADGIGSRIRQSIDGVYELQPAGRIAARAVVKAGDTSLRDLAQNVGVWLAPRAHVVHYPVRDGQEIALVVVTQDARQPEGWSTAITGDNVRAKVAGLAPELLALLGRADEWRQWTLATAPPLRSWSNGRAVLIGDATGPILPFLAQGAVMALEDAVELASALAASSDHTLAFKEFEAKRAPRRNRVANAAARNGKIYHLEGPIAAARNLTLRALSGARVMAGYDWLYGYQVP
jgi:salicylate hydroxylase